MTHKFIKEKIEPKLAELEAKFPRRSKVRVRSAPWEYPHWQRIGHVVDYDVRHSANDSLRGVIKIVAQDVDPWYAWEEDVEILWDAPSGTLP